MTEMQAHQGWHGKHSTRLQFIFIFSIFMAAALLFSQQLILGRILLLQFGGVPAVWLTALVVFQIILLLAYMAVYALRDLPAYKQLPLLAILLGAALAQHVFSDVSYASAGDINPWRVAWQVLSVGGLSLFALSMASPLLQKIYSHLPQNDAHDPYHFYSASNLGSLLGLMVVPYVAEPVFGIHLSNTLWGADFLFFALLFLYCVRKKRFVDEVPVSKADAVEKPKAWPLLVYSFLPAALSYGATSSLINDIAALPLLTMLPLALYLLSFVIAFNVKRGSASDYLTLATIAALLYAMAFITNVHRLSSLADLGLVLAAFFTAALYCHRKLADERPATVHLPYYYVMLALGGALGGFFNVFIIPYILPLSYEFTIFLALILLLSAPQDWQNFRKPGLRRLKIFAGIFCVGILAFLLQTTTMRNVFLHGALFISMALLVLWPAFMGVFAMLAVLCTLHLTPPILSVQRDFFGVKKVSEDAFPPNLMFHYLINGTTLHGMQQYKPTITTEPQTYYAWGSALGDVIKDFHPRNVAAVGMGAGTLACMPGKDAQLTFFEIDPSVLTIASTSFTYVIECPPKKVELGDARFTMEKSNDSFDLIVLDAFSSDAIPVHLLTREAFAIYEKHLNPGGIILVHISNRHLDLRPVLAAAASEFGWSAGYKRYDPGKVPGLSPSKYVLLTPDGAKIKQLQADYPDWEELPTSPQLPWTDDKILLLPIIKFFHSSMQE